jgi:hypothetical protein
MATIFLYYLCGGKHPLSLQYYDPERLVNKAISVMSHITVAAAPHSHMTARLAGRSAHPDLTPQSIDTVDDLEPVIDASKRRPRVNFSKVR